MQALALTSNQSWLPLLRPSIPIGWRLRLLRENFTQQTQAPANRIVVMLGRSNGNHDWRACVSCGFRLRNARNAHNSSDCIWMETGLYTFMWTYVTPNPSLSSLHPAGSLECTADVIFQGPFEARSWLPHKFIHEIQTRFIFKHELAIPHVRVVQLLFVFATRRTNSLTSSCSTSTI